MRRARVSFAGQHLNGRRQQHPERGDYGLRIGPLYSTPSPATLEHLAEVIEKTIWRKFALILKIKNKYLVQDQSRNSWQMSHFILS